MPKYTVEDSQTGKRVTFEWNDPNPPTDTDMEEVFSAARQEQPSKFTEMAKDAMSLLDPPVSVPDDVSPRGYFSRFLDASKEAFLAPVAPFIPSLRKRFLNPIAGQYGPSKMLEEEGRRVGGAIRSITDDARKSYEENPDLKSLKPIARPFLDTADDISDYLTPSKVQENLGYEGLTLGLSKLVRPIARGGAKLSELLTGANANNFRRLYDDPAAILPEAIGGSQSTKKAGAILGEAEKKAGFINAAKEGGESTKGFSKFEGKTSPFKGDQGLADAFYERVAKGDVLSPPEMLEAYKATSRTLRKMSRKDARYVEMVKFEKALSETLENISPEYAAAKANYARSAMGRATSNVLPRTQTGKVSQGRLGFNALLFGGGILNPAVAATAALSSPVVHGAGYAASSAAAKAIGSPGVGVGLRAILERYKQKQNKK